MKIAIYDNSSKFIEDTCASLNSISSQINVPAVIITYTNPYDLLSYYSNHIDFDIVILGQGMKDGYEIASEIKKIDKGVKIILVSEIGNISIRRYYIVTTHLLFKPLNQLQLTGTLKQIINEIKRDERFLINRTAERLDKIYYSDIMFIETSGRHTLIHTIDQTYDSYITMRKHMEMLLNMGFRQSHSSYIVNLEFIKTIRDNLIELRSGQKILLSQKRRKGFLKSFSDYYSEIDIPISNRA